jgi:ketosteroid isomerase-like protein
MMWRVDHEAMVRDTWAALARGDWDAVAAVLAPEAKWRAVESGPWDCENRAAIIAVLQENRALGLDGDVETVTDAGTRAIVGFRPSVERPGQWPLDHGIRYLVLSFDADGLVSEMKGCRDRAAALEYAGVAAA